MTPKISPKIKGRPGYVISSLERAWSNTMLLNKILLCFVQPLKLKVYHSHYEFFNGECLIGAMYCMLENDQPPEAANVLYGFEKVPYLLC